MSRGPGRWQRKVLDALAREPGAILTHAGRSHVEQNAIRRAAYTLEAAGKLKLVSQRIDGVRRLVVYRLDFPTPPVRFVTGVDGKQYRVPGDAA